METNSIFFFIAMSALIAVYISLGRRQYQDPRPHVNRERENQDFSGTQDCCC